MMRTTNWDVARVIPTNTYLPALSRDNVDVDISGIERITPTGYEPGTARTWPLDIIVYATGFYAYTDMDKALTFQCTAGMAEPEQ
jgi:cation diffusion facilitator CzcD-associated flavoprotein CzcO